MGGIPSKTVSDTSTGDCEHIHSHLPRQNRSSSVPPVRELQSGHASSRTTPRRSHSTLLTPSQCPNPWVVPPRDNIAHFVLAGPTQTCAKSRVTYRSSATAWAHADATKSALARAGQPRQEPRKAGPPSSRQSAVGSVSMRLCGRARPVRHSGRSACLGRAGEHKMCDVVARWDHRRVGTLGGGQ